MAKSIDISQLTDEQRKEILRENNRKNGLKGGLKVKEKGADYFKEIGRKGAAARQKRKEEGGKY
jgi:hypothetical protein